MSDHLAIWEMEMAWDRSHKSWCKYINAFLKAMGETHDDGDERTDGYSLDSMYDAYRAGMKPSEYADRRHTR